MTIYGVSKITNMRVIIPSRNVRNLAHCVQAIRENEPCVNMADSLIIIDDDESGQIRQFCENYSICRIEGPKPFIFARNANLGLEVAFTGADAAILLNDDALLQSTRGFSALYDEVRKNPQFGILSATTNVAGNENQYRQRNALMIRREYRTLCFICVLITRRTWETIGPLDERYSVDYGVEDGDYSYRARKAGLRLGIVDRCYVDHGSLPSTFRGEGPIGFEENKRLFEEKWGIPYESA
jgi:GT2 family glycosyltransferase